MVAEPVIGLAGVGDAVAATAILREAAIWLMARDRPLWPPEMFTEAETARRAEGGGLVVARDHGSPVACMFIDICDPVFWPEPVGTALYLHKIVVTRAAAGQGWPQRLIDWADSEARRRKMSALRLDCAQRPQLIELYRSLGFVDVDDFAVGFGLVVRRFERRLTQ